MFASNTVPYIETLLWPEDFVFAKLKEIHEKEQLRGLKVDN